MKIAATWRTFSEDARHFLGGAILLELGHAFLWVLQNLYVRSLGHDDEAVGQILAAAGVGVVLSTIPAAALYDRLGARRSLVLSSIGAALSLAGMACCEGLGFLFVFAALQGAFFTLHRVVAAPFLVTASTPAERTSLFGAEMATHSIASMVGLAVAGLIAGSLEAHIWAETGALRATLLLGAAATLGALPFYRRIRLSEAMPEQEVAPARRRMFAILAPSHWHLWWRMALPHVFMGLGAGLTIPFINLYFTDRFALPKSQLGVVMSTSQLTMTVGILAIPWAVRRMGFLKATIASEALSLPFFLILAFTTSFPVALVAFVFRSALMNLSHPMWRNLMMELTPPDWRAAVNGVTMLAWTLGWAMSNQMGGILIERSPGWIGDGSDGYVVPMLITTTLYVLSIVLEAAFFWNVRHLGRAGADSA